MLMPVMMPWCWWWCWCQWWRWLWWRWWCHDDDTWGTRYWRWRHRWRGFRKHRPRGKCWKQDEVEVILSDWRDTDAGTSENLSGLTGNNQTATDTKASYEDKREIEISQCVKSPVHQMHICIAYAYNQKVHFVKIPRYALQALRISWINNPIAMDTGGGGLELESRIFKSLSWRLMLKSPFSTFQTFQL